MSTNFNEAVGHLETFINSTLTNYYSNNTINIFDRFVSFCQNYYDKPVHNMAEMRMKKNTKLKGDIFELFAQKYLKHCFHKPDFVEVWLLKEVPDVVLVSLGLKRNDLGIDLIAVDAKGKYYAIQAKYRKKGYKAVHGVGWKGLSTFYGLVTRSGPWERYIIITNANYVRHVGKKIKKDLSICYGTLCKIGVEDWSKMANLRGYTLNDSLDMVDKKIEVKEQHNHKKKITIIKKIENTEIENTEIENEKIKLYKKIGDTKSDNLNLVSLRERRLAYFYKNN